MKLIEFIELYEGDVDSAEARIKDRRLLPCFVFGLIDEASRSVISYHFETDRHTADGLRRISLYEALDSVIPINHDFRMTIQGLPSINVPYEVLKHTNAADILSVIKESSGVRFGRAC